MRKSGAMKRNVALLLGCAVVLIAVFVITAEFYG